MRSMREYLGPADSHSHSRSQSIDMSTPPRRLTRSQRQLALAAMLLAVSAIMLLLLVLGVISLPPAAALRTTSGEQWREVVSWKPRAFLYHNFLSKDECAHLVKLARSGGGLRKSKVVVSTTGETKVSEARTSSGRFLERAQDSVVRAVEERIAEHSFVPASHGEALYVLRYAVGDKYDPHVDYFPTNLGGAVQRIATMLMYLSDVDEGGETVFPVGEAAMNWTSEWSSTACGARKGVAVKPRMGDALLFWNLKPDGTTVDEKTYHRSCPVIRGHKWVATKWMHRYQFD